MGMALNLTARPETNIWLHPEYHAQMVNVWEETDANERASKSTLPKNAIRAGEFQKLLRQRKWMRLVLFEETEQHQYLVLMGLYRLVKDKQTQCVWAERARLTRDKNKLKFEWSWVKTKIMPTFQLQNFSSNLINKFNEVFEAALIEIVQDLQQSGVRYVRVPLKNDPKNDEMLRECTGKLQVKQTWLDLTQPWCQSALKGRVLRQVSGIDFKGQIAGSRALYKHLWHFVDRRHLSLYLKIHHGGLPSVVFADFQAFYALGIDVAYFEANEVWLLWLRGMNTKHYTAPNLFSYDYLLPLLKSNMTKKKIRRINQFPRSIQSRLVGRYDFDLQIAREIKAYPTSVILRIFDEVVDHNCGMRDEHEAGLKRLVSLWSDYFSSMIGEVKPSKHKTQWTRAINQLADVSHWYFQGGVIHKNQNWYALTQQHDQWVARLNEREQMEDAHLDASSWKPAEWDRTAVKSGKVVIEEITQGATLRLEGREMEHCVWDYLTDCRKQRYRVFSLSSPAERMTLGLWMNPVSLQCRYDQLRGLDNEPASKGMLQLAKRLIKQINADVAKS